MPVARVLVLPVLVLASALAACAADGEGDEFADESAERDDAAGKADDVVGNYDYFTARRDERRCTAPLCGGVWVDRVNRLWTRCADGSYQEACYVADVFVEDLGWSATDLGDIERSLGEGRVVLRGGISSGELDGIEGLGRFDASEVWLGGGQGQAAGLFTRITDSGIRCFTTPCSSLHEGKLNSALEAMIADLDLEPTGADEAAIDLAYQAIASPDGLLVAGFRTTTSGPAGEAKAREVHEFYTRRVPGSSAPCVVTGCSGQLCADEPIASTCEWLPEYACYPGATCERQPDGVCGFTATAELDACLADPPA